MNLMDQYNNSFLLERLGKFKQIVHSLNQNYKDSIGMDVYRSFDNFDYIHDIEKVSYPEDHLLCKGISISHSRSYSWAPTSPYDEGWGIEEGTFENPIEYKVPSWLFTVNDDEIVQRLEAVYKNAYKNNLEKNLEFERRKLVETQNKIEKIQEKIKELG